MSRTVTEVKEYQWCTRCQWRDVANGQLLDDFEAYTGNLYARVAESGAEEARLVIAAAHEAFGGWADTPPVEKARLFSKAAEIVRAEGWRSQRFSHGKPGARLRSRPSSRTWSPRRWSSKRTGCICRKGQCWRRIWLTPSRSGCGDHWVWSPAFTPRNGANILAWCAVLNPLAAATRGGQTLGARSGVGSRFQRHHLDQHDSR
jgi:Aldehyde dehydrogenase family